MQHYFDLLFSGVDGTFYFLTALAIICFTIYQVVKLVVWAIKLKQPVVEELDDDEEDEENDTLGEIKALLEKQVELLDEQNDILGEIRDAVVKPKAVASNHDETK